ncbi:UDPglucose 6-dehydrogenase [Oikeobacillus pervagus]|uniref:UDP-glucose 6-dehydrogenase n=1 Tax=Oikeobacillus pervagus TaxID=1325931 RepID=A0AAJ1T081_9BACI|nr:UDP-glucose/GDP-mannose dehydrogenase family protein [Oikeobacillus pervagus]MDQ0215924.1 UDPglucose 6-dehydrogenase [Oikeobacillus pervagus]
MKMKLAIAGTGYVGLVTGVTLSDVGHTVTCFDVDEQKIQILKQGTSPIFEPGLEEMIRKNTEEGRLSFTTKPKIAYEEAECIFIAVGTPEGQNGSANLQYVERAAIAIAKHAKNNPVVVIKSTVPVGTNEKIEKILYEYSGHHLNVVSNPEFLREGSAIVDTFSGDRIVIGASDKAAGDRVEAIYKPLKLPIVRTDIRSAEMIKYASNAFLATKISFINEIAILCEKTGANIIDVAKGMGMDKRIGEQFLRAGIGFGGSCFPKDTNALQKLALDYDYQFKILSSVTEVNHEQKKHLFHKAKQYFQDLNGKKVAILGLSFKPNTDDIREAPSLDLIQELLLEGAEITVYDPIAMENVKKIYGDRLQYASSVSECIEDKEIAFIVTEWKDIRDTSFATYRKLMREPMIIDGRNCYSLEEAAKEHVNYISIGRKPVFFKKFQ